MVEKQSIDGSMVQRSLYSEGGRTASSLRHPSEMFVLVVICIRAWLQWLNTYQFINITTAGVDTDS